MPFPAQSSESVSLCFGLAFFRPFFFLFLKLLLSGYSLSELSLFLLLLPSLSEESDESFLVSLSESLEELELELEDFCPLFWLSSLSSELESLLLLLASLELLDLLGFSDGTKDIRTVFHCSHLWNKNKLSALGTIHKTCFCQAFADVNIYPLERWISVESKVLISYLVANCKTNSQSFTRNTWLKAHHTLHLMF